MRAFFFVCRLVGCLLVCKPKSICEATLTYEVVCHCYHKTLCLHPRMPPLSMLYKFIYQNIYIYSYMDELVCSIATGWIPIAHPHSIYILSSSAYTQNVVRWNEFGFLLFAVPLRHGFSCATTVFERESKKYSPNRNHHCIFHLAAHSQHNRPSNSTQPLVVGSTAATPQHSSLRPPCDRPHSMRFSSAFLGRVPSRWRSVESSLSSGAALVHKLATLGRRSCPRTRLPESWIIHHRRAETPAFSHKSATPFPPASGYLCFRNMNLCTST